MEMQMWIEIPSGRIILNGRTVASLHYKPYILLRNGDRRYLTDEEKKAARDMRKTFSSLIDNKPKKLSDFL